MGVAYSELFHFGGNIKRRAQLPAANPTAVGKYDKKREDTPFSQERIPVDPFITRPHSERIDGEGKNGKKRGESKRRFRTSERQEPKWQVFFLFRGRRLLTPRLLMQRLNGKALSRLVDNLHRVVAAAAAAGAKSRLFRRGKKENTHCGF